MHTVTVSEDKRLSPDESFKEKYHTPVSFAAKFIYVSERYLTEP